MNFYLNTGLATDKKLIGILFKPNDESNGDFKKSLKNYIEFLYNFIPVMSDIFILNEEDGHMSINCKNDLIEDNNIIECDKILRMFDYLFENIGSLKIYLERYRRTKDESYKIEINHILINIVKIFFEMIPSFKNVADIDEYNYKFKSIGDIIIMEDTDSLDDDCEDDIDGAKVLLINNIDLFINEILKLEVINYEDLDDEDMNKIVLFSNLIYRFKLLFKDDTE